MSLVSKPFKYCETMANRKYRRRTNVHSKMKDCDIGN